jgi:excisionase family DNA binding protein
MRIQLSERTSGGGHRGSSAEGLIDGWEAARRLAIRPRTLRLWVRQRRIGYVRVGRLVRFDPTVIEAFIRRGIVAALDGPRPAA